MISAFCHVLKIEKYWLFCNSSRDCLVLFSVSNSSKAALSWNNYYWNDMVSYHCPKMLLSALKFTLHAFYCLIISYFAASKSILPTNGFFFNFWSIDQFLLTWRPVVSEIWILPSNSIYLWIGQAASLSWKGKHCLFCEWQALPIFAFRGSSIINK